MHGEAPVEGEALGGKRRKLPIGMQTFRRLREEGCYYVDKTAHLQRLIAEGTHYFLSRPRRFGKSLLIDTLKELFESNEALFKGLAVYPKWDWSIRHPVLRLDFSGRNFTEPGHLRRNLAGQLRELEQSVGLEASDLDGPERLGKLLRMLHQATGRRVVLLVDEYDKPILDALTTPELARANRDYLRGLYSAIKFNDAHIQFTLLTGVSKFSKVSLFSGVNNLKDITLDRRYATICGYTERDLVNVFAPELPGLHRQRVREWYNGYRWRGKPVYNPFDILLLFDTREFRAHWFETGTSTFLVDLLKRRGVPSPALDGMMGTEALLSTFDVDDMPMEALLFQTGYLTIQSEEDWNGTARYRLGFPNREVRQGLNESLLNALLPETSRRLAQSRSLGELLARNDFTGLEALFRGIFASIPHQWHTRNDIANYEGYYASVFYSCFAAEGLDAVGEDSGSGGRADMTVRGNNEVYLFEFKTVASAPEGTALAQLRANRYADKYRHLNQPIHLIGVEFSRAERNIAAFRVERDGTGDAAH